MCVGGELVFLVWTFSHPLEIMCGLGSPDGNRWTQTLSYTAVVSSGRNMCCPACSVLVFAYLDSIRALAKHKGHTFVTSVVYTYPLKYTCIKIYVISSTSPFLSL